MIDGPLKADGRLAAKNATKIRAALTQVTNFKSVFDRYQETQPQPSKNRTQDRARARAWIMLNVGFNNEALHTAIMHAWAEAYVLGQDAANEWLAKTEEAQKAISGGVNWDTWKPGDRATALLVKPVGGFKRYLEQSGGASYFKKFDKETTEMLGTALADAIAAGLDSEAAALLMKDYVGSAGRALTIAITEQNRAMSFSTIQRYKEADLEKMEWHVSDPCDICKQNAGVVINIGSAFPSGDAQPPAHPHCRCVLLPVIPGMEEEPTMVDGTPMPSTAGGLTEIPGIAETTKPITVVSGKTIGGIEEDKFFKTQKLYAQNTDLPMWEQPPGEQRLAAAYQIADYNKLPEVLDAKQFDELANKPGTIKVYRGIGGPQAPQYVEQYKTGQHYAGQGVFGNGSYSTTNYDTARLYGLGDKNIMEILLPDTSNYISTDNLRELGKNVRNDLDKIIKEGISKAKADMKTAGYTNLSNPIWQAWIEKQVQYDEIRTLIDEEGTLATLAGYDGIKIDVEKKLPTDKTESYYIILNRGKVKVKA